MKRVFASPFAWFAIFLASQFTLLALTFGQRGASPESVLWNGYCEGFPACNECSNPTQSAFYCDTTFPYPNCYADNYDCGNYIDLVTLEPSDQPCPGLLTCYALD